MRQIVKIEKASGELTKIEYNDGSIYVGQVNQKNEPHIKGILIFSNGDQYDGE